MPKIIAVNSALPPYYYKQSELAGALLQVSEQAQGNFRKAAITRFFDAVGVSGRHLALPIERYLTPSSFAERNAEWLSCAIQLGEQAVGGLLGKVGLNARDVQLFATTTVTGIAVPSIEAHLMNRLHFSAQCRRLPLFGLGCLAGAAGIARTADYLRAYPSDAAVFLSVELCSLTLQPQDASIANLIACGLFGDGAAAVLMVGDDHPLSSTAQTPAVVDSRSVLFPGTERVMGWDVVSTGLRIVLSSDVPVLARTALARSIREFLGVHRQTPYDVGTWIAHPGGPAVIDGMEQGLELRPGTLDASRECLARIGNLSSASVLILLEETLARAIPTATSGLLLAMGPGFCAELVLLRW